MKRTREHLMALKKWMLHGFETAIVTKGTIAFAAIDIVMNSFSRDEILAKLKALSDRDAIRVMIHEQYFYPDYPAYQPDFEEKLNAAFSYLKSLGYKSRFFEEQI